MKIRRISLVGEGRFNENESKCFFCNDVVGFSGFYKVLIFEIDRSVRESVIKLKDIDFLVKFVDGDMVVIEVKYYVKCLVVLYN